MEVDKALKVVVVCVECAASVVAIIKKVRRQSND